MGRILAVALGRGERDLDALETAVRTAVLEAGAKALGMFLSATAKGVEGPGNCADCGDKMRATGPRKKRILTLLGEVEYIRPRHRCLACGTARYPADEALDLANTSRSPGVRRQTARLGAKETFREVAQDLRELAGITLSRKDAERITEGVGADIESRDARQRRELCLAEPPPPEAPKTVDTLYIELDGTGVPMVPGEVAGRKGKQPDGSAKTREAKLGCVFTQTATGEGGRPVRDPASTTFTGAIEDAATFGKRLYAEAVRRGLHTARRVVVLGDGAQWIENLVGLHFGTAVRIVDLYHAKEHVAELARALFAKPLPCQLHRERWWGLLEDGHIEEIARQAAEHLPRDPKANPDARRHIAYLEKNKEHMRYANFRQQGIFVGSGVIEAACKNIVGKRLKQSGMQWTVDGANKVIAIRCAALSNRLDDYWEQRAA